MGNIEFTVWIFLQEGKYSQLLVSNYSAFKILFSLSSDYTIQRQPRSAPEKNRDPSWETFTWEFPVGLANTSSDLHHDPDYSLKLSLPNSASSNIPYQICIKVWRLSLLNSASSPFSNFPLQWFTVSHLYSKFFLKVCFWEDQSTYLHYSKGLILSSYPHTQRQCCFDPIYYRGFPVIYYRGFPGGSDSKESPWRLKETWRRPRFDPWVKKIPWRRN